MSIRDEVNRRVADGAIHRVWPVGSQRRVRELYVSGPIYWRAVHQLDVPPRRKRRWYDAGRDLRRFAEDQIIEVRDEAGGGSDDALLVRLDPPNREVWEVRSLKNPQMRFFGRFFETDKLVVLAWRWKDDIPDRAAYEAPMAECETTWANLFRREEPLRNGEFPNDYLSRFRISR